MRRAEHWKEFSLLDAAGGEKLERWGNVVLIRPDPQVIWQTQKGPEWERADARYHRSSKGGGCWEFQKAVPESWVIGYGEKLRFKISPTGFKHTGLFPEQAVNWDLFGEIIRKGCQNRREPVKVLNLFAYTGGATLACAAAGAAVCHVDASKGMVAWARENQALSGLSDKPVRWIVDDCRRFVEREIRRGSFYDGILMDPPSYGRGPGGEVWKLEDSVYDLVKLCAGALSKKPLFFAVNSYTTGLSPSVMEYILGVTVGKIYPGGTLMSDEIGLTVEATGQALPCGATAMWLAGGQSR